MATYTTQPLNPGNDETFTLIWRPSPLYSPLPIGTYTISFISNRVIASQQTQITSPSTNIIYWIISGLPAGIYSVNVEGPAYDETAAPLRVTCFVEGSEILCIKNEEEEYVKVEDLKEGDLVKTYKNSPKQIKHIMKKVFKNDNSRSKICKLSGHPNQTKDLYLTGGHSILVDELTEKQEQQTINIWKKVKKIEDKCLLLCFLDDNNDKIDDEKEYNVYHIALENDNLDGQYGIYANGLLTESISINEYLKSNNLLSVSCNDEFIL